MTTSVDVSRYRFVCPACGKGSTSPDDAANGYCGACHWWTGDPLLSTWRPELFRRPADQPGGRRGARGWAADLLIVDEPWPPAPIGP
jgi:ribosomal protein S27AE